MLMSRHVLEPVRDLLAEGAALPLGCHGCIGPDQVPRPFSAPRSSGSNDGLRGASQTPRCPAINVHTGGLLRNKEIYEQTLAIAGQLQTQPI